MTKGYKYSREGYLNENFKYFHLRDTAGQERDFHFHEFDKIVIFISGGVDYSIEGTVYHLEPWDVLLVRHHMIHKALIDRALPYDRIIIYIDSAYADRFAPAGNLMECFAAAEKRHYCLMRPDSAERELLGKCLERLEESMTDELFGAQLMRETMLTQLMVLLNRIMQSDTSYEQNNVEYNEKIADVLSYINENITRQLSVDELSAVSYLSRYHFMRLFKSQTGCTVHTYIRQKRLTLAARLLREGMSATAVSAECGFSDYSTFHRAFKQTFGVSPGKIKSIM